MTSAPIGAPLPGSARSLVRSQIGVPDARVAIPIGSVGDDRSQAPVRSARQMW